MCLNEICGEICIGKMFSGTFATQNGLKQGDALLPMLLTLL
jgi:hypothetical protein